MHILLASIAFAVVVVKGIDLICGKPPLMPLDYTHPCDGDIDFGWG